MAKPQQIESRIERLANEIDGIGRQKVDFRSLWDEVKSIQADFGQTRFDSPDDRKRAWDRFQAVVAKMKSGIDRSKAANQARFEKSQEVLRRIHRLAQAAIPSSDFEDLVFHLATFGMATAIKAAVNALPGPPIDERKMELESCSRALREGWALHRESREILIGAHRAEGWQALKDAGAKLDAAWAQWRDAKSQTRAARQAQFEQRDRERSARQAEYERKQAEFKSRVRANIAKNEASLSKAEDAEDRVLGNIANLRDRISNARHPDQIARLEGFLDEAEGRLASIRDSIARLREWIRQDRDKL